MAIAGTAGGALTVVPVPLREPALPGADLGALVSRALETAGVQLAAWDVVVVTHKVVSKVEGRLVDLTGVVPGEAASRLASTGAGGGDPRLVEVVLGETVRVVRADGPVLLCETRHGLVCANAGVDRSNVEGGERVTLLPVDPDGSAARLRTALTPGNGAALGVIISDTFGRPFRTGGVNVAIGVAGMPAAADHTGLDDPWGYRLRAGLIGTADEIAGAAELVMGKVDGVPVAVVRGLRWEGEGTAADLLRRASEDLFRGAPGAAAAR